MTQHFSCVEQLLITFFCPGILWVQYFAVMPGNDLHSNLQIDVMRTQNLTILHALNGHRLGAGEMHLPF